MIVNVLLTRHAARDLEELHNYISLRDHPDQADHVLDQVEKAFSSLAASPERGVYPKELVSIGIRDFREIYFKPYRIIYRIIEPNVYVLLMADGRRDMQTLLYQRLLES